MIVRQVVLFLLLATLTVACTPSQLITAGKTAVVSLSVDGVRYSVDEYCDRFSQEYRKNLRQRVNFQSKHQILVTCYGDDL